MIATLCDSVKISLCWQTGVVFQPFPRLPTFTLPPRTLDRKLDKKLSILDSNVVSGDFHCIDNANVCNFILSLEKWKQRVFLSFTQTFLLHTFVDTANGQQNCYYFPILCIFTQALVDLTNIRRFSLWHWAEYLSVREKAV